MSKLRDFGVATDGQRYLYFRCPGCKYGHAYTVPRWTWNGSMDKPTFTPSLLIDQHRPESRCHLFVTDGRIQFCGDCHHELAGQTVVMEDEESPDPSGDQETKGALPGDGR